MAGKTGLDMKKQIPVRKPSRSHMTFQEIRCVEHLVTTAHGFGPIILCDYQSFKRAVWHDDSDMKRFDFDCKRFERCLKFAYVRMTQTGPRPTEPVNCLF
jgi:hypothetical protein